MTDNKTNVDEDFVRLLEKNVGGEHNRAIRAELRRYWSPTTRHYATMALGKLQALRTYLSPEALLALLYAEHPDHRSGGETLGKALLRLAGGNSSSEAFPSFERHFRRLLACEGGDLEELSRVLHRLVRRLAKESIPLDFNQLLWDLRKWRKKSDEVKTQWTRAFYTAPSPESLLVTDTEKPA